MDRFSFILVDLSLRALATRPMLFKSFSNGDNIILTGADFQNPHGSQALKELRAIPDLKPTTEDFVAICLASAEHVPSLGDFLARRSIPKPPIKSSASAASAQPKAGIPIAVDYAGPYPVIEGTDYKTALAHVGDMVEIVGRIVEVHTSYTRYGNPYVFINFGDWKYDSVKAVIWVPNLTRIPNKPDASWVGRWISVIGMPTTYRHPKRNYLHVDIEIQDSSRLRLIDEAEAMRRLMWLYGVALVVLVLLLVFGSLQAPTSPKRPSSQWNENQLTEQRRVEAARRVEEERQRVAGQEDLQRALGDARRLTEQREAERQAADAAEVADRARVVEELRRQQEAEAKRSRLVWKFQNFFGSTVLVAFYAQSRPAAWPGGDTQTAVNGWPITSGLSRVFSLQCLPGEQICYGAWGQGDAYGGYWGVGPGGGRGCRNCCYTCGSDTNPITLSR
jgi:hypothetical protein